MNWSLVAALGLVFIFYAVAGVFAIREVNAWQRLFKDHLYPRGR
jgi:hypothetical protein